MNNEEIERAQWHEELRREDAKRAHDQNEKWAFSAREAALRLAEFFLKTLTIINGGAVVGLLSFYESISGEKHYILTAAGIFAAGAVFSLAAAGLAFFTQEQQSRSHSLMKNQWDFPYVIETSASIKAECRRSWIYAFTVFFAVASLIILASGVAYLMFKV